MRKLLLLCFLPACLIDAPTYVQTDGGAGDDVTIDAAIDATPSNAQLSTEQAPYDFGDVVTDAMSAPLVVTFKNTGTDPTGELDVTLGGANQGEFEIVSAGADDCAGKTLDADATCLASVRFAPHSGGAQAAKLEVSASPGGTASVDLSGNGLSPGSLEITAGATLPFSTIEIQSSSATQTLTVHNLGGAPSATLSTVIADPTSYSASNDSCDGHALDGGASCSVDLTFHPTVVGSLPSQISVRESPTAGVAASATGTGTARLRVNMTGTGAVDSVPGGISCTTCGTTTVSFSQSPVTLSTSNVGSFVFDGWTGSCASANPSTMCTVPLTVPLTTVGATFLEVFPLEVTINSGGSVNSSPSGIQCGGGLSDCGEGYKSGTSVMLTATPDANYEVFAWTGAPGCTSGMHMCSVTMSQARSVTVEFKRQYTVTVVPGGSGSGTITGGSINCPGTCSATLFSGSMLTLTEAPGTAGTNSQIVFGGWSGGTCSGSGTTCPVTFDADRTVNAAFTLQYRYELKIQGAGTGTASGPGGFSCATSSCTHYYDVGSSIGITALPTNGTNSYFIGWTDQCWSTVGGTGLNRTCTMTMTQPRSETVRFAQQPGNMVFVSAGLYHSNLGGTAAYDALCNSLATSAGLNNGANNGFIAWMSDDNSSAKTRLGASTRGFARMDGLPFGDDQAGLFAYGSKVFYPITLDENGTELVSEAEYFTGTDRNGNQAVENCTNWTSASEGGFTFGARAGRTHVGSYWAGGGIAFCADDHRILCVGKTSTTAFAPNPSGNKRIFLTNSSWVSGTSTPDQACAASKPSGAGTVHAVIATTTTSAASKLEPTTIYTRPDSTYVGSTTEIIANHLRSGLWQQGNGVYVEQAFRTGAPVIDAIGIDTCANWTSADAATMAWSGLNSSILGSWWRYWEYNCDVAVPLLCVEE